MQKSEMLKLQAENEQLRAELLKATVKLDCALESNAALSAQMTDLQEKLDIIINQFNKQKKKQHSSKNEHHNPRQAPESANESGAGESHQPSSNGGDAPPAKKFSAEVKAKRAANREAKNRAMAELAPRTVVHSLSPDQLKCPNCSKSLKVFTHKVSPQIEKLITSLEVIKHMQEVASCQSCKIGMATAVKPATPISGCLLGPRLLANTFVNRFNDGTPYYRIKRSLSREGYPVPLSNFSNWQIRAASAAKPLYDLIKSEILLSKIIKTDDTECKIQVSKLKLRKTKTPRNIRKGKMTAILGDKNHPFNLFDFSPDKSFARNIAFFRNFSGYIQADGAGGFDVLFLANSLTLRQCFEVGCHAHARRKFYDCLTTHIKEAAFILDLYQVLFEIEDRINGKSSEEILTARQIEAKPILEQIKSKLLELKPTLTPKDEFLVAINYFLKNWDALSRYLSDPDLDISNNDTERLIKEFVLVRKNILFMGSDKAGHASAILMTLIASANRNKLNPVDYLADVFTRINSLAHDPELLRQLLPDRWTPPPPTVSHSI